jgi:hypothetical protein
VSVIGPAGSHVRNYQPSRLRRWVEALPYTDPLACARALCQTAYEVAPLSLPPEQRLEVLGCLATGELRLVHEQTHAAAEGRLQSVADRRKVHVALRALALELAAGGRQVTAEFTHHLAPGVERLAESLLFTIRFLGHAIVLDYQELNPPVRPLWQELNQLLQQAERLGLDEHPAADPDRADAFCTVRRAWLEVAATALADPYRLPYGMAWWVFGQIREWSTHMQLHRAEAHSFEQGLFWADLSVGEPPAVQSRSAPELPGQVDSLRVIDLSALSQPIERALAQWQQAQPAEAPLRQRVEAVLQHLLRSFQLPPRRNLPREPRAGLLQLYPGVQLATALLRDRQPLAASLSGDGQSPPQPLPEGEAWTLVNSGPAGYAVSSQARAREPLPIGELVGVVEQRDGREALSIGVVRWTMVRRDGSQLCGLQVLARRVVPGRLEPLDGEGLQVPVMHLERQRDTGSHGVFAERGVFSAGARFRLAGPGGRNAFEVRATRLLEASERFDYFEVLRDPSPG